MSRSTIARVTRLVAISLALILALSLAGCSGSKSSSTTGGATTPPVPTSAPTAKQTYPTAKSSLSTMAPDAKMLLVTTANVITPTSTPVWQYLFGSQKDGKTYAVTVQNGKAIPQAYGTAGLGAAEWAQIPGESEWKIDSDVAVQKALGVYTVGTKDTAYILGLVTYVPKSSGKSKVQPMVWSISFDPASKGSAPTSTVNVNAVTGEAAYAK